MSFGFPRPGQWYWECDRCGERVPTIETTPDIYVDRLIKIGIDVVMLRSAKLFHCMQCGDVVGSRMPPKIMELSALVDAVVESSGKFRFAVRREHVKGYEYPVWRYAGDY